MRQPASAAAAIGPTGAAGALVVALAITTGCGAGAGGGGTDLTITVTPDAGVAPDVWSLTCDPPGGTHPDPTAACAFLEEQAAADVDPFAPVPEDTLCTQQYGGPAVATVEGTWQGDDVSASFNLTNGCEIARWALAEPLLVLPPFTN